MVNIFIRNGKDSIKMTEEDNIKYLEFASKISFFEFLQEEFKERSFNTSNYLKEIEWLKQKEEWNLKELSDFLIKNPKLFEIFEELFQLIRFTNTQLIHFLFDVNILNGVDTEKTILYLKKNLKFDELFADIFIKQSEKAHYKNFTFKNVEHALYFLDNYRDIQSIDYAILVFKSTLMSYINSAIDDVNIIHKRISNPHFTDVAERIAEYLIMNLRLNKILKSYNLKNFLENKMIPNDTKAIHGNFGKIKICKVLEKHNLVNANEHLQRNNIKTIDKSLSTNSGLNEFKGKLIYVTESYVNDIKKRKDNKPKLFDFVLLYDLKPKILIETNFFSTSGTKIGINQGEYVDLNEDIKKNYSDLIFLWITDGNYWLTSDGKNRMLNLFRYFDDCIMNYNLFDQKLEELKEKIKFK